jgi:hypothetical protein
LSSTNTQPRAIASAPGARASRAAWGAWWFSLLLQALAVGLGQPLSSWRLLLPLSAIALLLLPRLAARPRLAPPLLLLALLLLDALVWSSALEATLLHSPMRVRGLLGWMAAGSLGLLLGVYVTRRRLGPSWSRAAAAPSVLLAAITCPLFLLELACSLVPPSAPVNVYEVVPDVPRSGHLYRPHARCMHALRPGFRGAYSHPEFPGSRVEINALGLRDGLDEETPPAAGEQSILVLGDSFAFGTGVELHETFQELLETRAADFAAAPVRVYGAGVPGFGTLDSLYLLDELAERTRPDVVVLAFYEGNDLWDNMRLEQVQQTEQAEQAAAQDPGQPATAREPARALLPDFLRAATRLPFWVGYSTAFRRLLPALEPLLVRLGFVVTNRFLSESLREHPPPGPQAAFRYTVELVDEMNRACSGLDATLIVVLIPAAIQADPRLFEAFREAHPAGARAPLRRTLLHERLVSALREHAVVLDLLPALERLIRDGQACYHREGHFNARGHGLVAEQLVPLLAEALAGDAASLER